jgi:photosystem II stability/assembly factor-like uncharacterized protein
LSSSSPILTGGPHDLTVHIFVGYAHEDKRWFDQEYRFNLIPFLKESLRRDNTEFWYDKELMGGDEYKRLIESEIDKAQIALLMVSQHFLNSEFIETFELPRIAARAERKELVVIPVLVEPCNWHDFPFLADRQMVPGSSPLIHHTESEPKWADVRFEILDGLRRQVKRTRLEMQEKERKERQERERKEREEKERKERQERERKEREEKERKEREEKERKEREEKDRKAPELVEQKAREEAERKKREEQQRKGREEKKDSPKDYALLFAALKRIFALVPLACVILVADLVFHLWLGHAGAKWAPLDSGITGPVLAITGSPDGKTLYACGAGRSFLVSTDGGATWTNHTTNEPSNCLSIALTPDGKKILIPATSITGPLTQTISAISAILWTYNGGVDWETIQLEDLSQLLSSLKPIDIANLPTGPGINSSGTYTLPQKTQESIFFSPKAYALPIQMRGIFSDGTRTMAVGDKGEIFGTEYQSKDIGVQHSGVQATLNAVTGTPDGKFLIAVGDKGTYLETADWGITWRSDTSWRSPAGFGTPDLNAVFMTADGQQICAVGNYGTVFTSSDEGVHWTIRYAGVRSNLLGVFGTANGKHLWAVGASGMILESNDGGATWKQRPSGVKVDLNAIYGTSDGKTLWVAGDNGTILTSKRSLFF